MQNKQELILGGVYRFDPDQRLYRIIGLDAKEVLYDVFIPELDEWMMKDHLARKGSYYRMRYTFFLEHTCFVELQPLTDRELAIFRPDLPLRICRFKDIQWTDKTFRSLDSYRAHLIKTGHDLSDQIFLEIPTLFLRPYGSRGGHLATMKIHALNEKGFSPVELLWQAQNLQAMHIKQEERNGVGIFRLGHEQKTPVYYIGHYLDKASIIKD